MVQELMDFVTVLDRKIIDKADFCLGAAVVPLSGPGIEDATCGNPERGNERLLSDFDVAAAGLVVVESSTGMNGSNCSASHSSRVRQALERRWR